MEEKRYPHIDEEESVGKVSEPVAEVAIDYSHSVDGITEVHDWIDDLDWDRYPILGPTSEEEAIGRIKKAEADLKDPSKWVTSDQMWDQLYEKYPWLR